MAQLLDSLTWQHYPIPATSAVGQLHLEIGEAGDGGPTALIVAGVHGDEGPWGAWAIRKLLEAVPAADLLGTVRVIPVANPLAMQADARCAPVDQLDLNRAFPGSATGSYTERLAAAIVAHALPGADYVIDLHGGGSWCVNAFTFRMPGGDLIADAFDAPFVTAAPERGVTLTGYARTLGAVVGAVEMGGRSAIEDAWAGRIAAGLYRALVAAGVLHAGGHFPAKAADSQPVGGTSVLRPAQGGIFVPRLGAGAVGTVVPRDTVLGHLLDPVTGAVIETFHAPFDQTGLLLLRPMIAQVEGGAMTYVVAEPES